VIGALTTTALTMAAKAAIKGNAYGWEEAAQDAAIGVVEAIAAGLTAGFGGKLLGGLGLAKELDNLVLNLVRKSVSHFVSGAVQAAPGAFLGTLLNDGTFMDRLSQILQGGLMSVAMGHLTDPITTHFQAKKAFNARTNPVEFEKTYQSYKKEHPGTDPAKVRAKLRDELDGMILAGRPGAFREPAMQNAMSAELLEGLPAPQRKAWERAHIDVVREGDFKRLSPSGEPGVTMKDGVPHLRAPPGTDLAALAKQSPHLFRGPAEPLGLQRAAAAVTAEPTPRARIAAAKPETEPRVPGAPHETPDAAAHPRQP